MLDTIVTTDSDTSQVDAAFRSLVAGFQPTFPGRAEVDQALAFFGAEQYPDRYLPYGDRWEVAELKRVTGSAVSAMSLARLSGIVHDERVTHEGPTAFLEVTPGYVRVRRLDPARAERAAQRALEARQARVDEAVRVALSDEDDEDRPSTVRRVTEWSRKSRANMVRVLASLDYRPLLADPELVPAMVTLTYPGDWLSVAPSAKVCQRHLNLLRKAFFRHYGYRLDGIWKREFQDRGAPHFHILMTPPRGFQAWLAETWCRIVDAASCGASEAVWSNGSIVCCEFHRHLAVHLGPRVVDFNEGARALDPKRIGIYFAKHGGYAAKEYQNQAPREWMHGHVREFAWGTGYACGPDCEGCADEGVGRFWGRWGLERVVGVVPIAEDVAEAILRTLRRHSRANSYFVKRRVWRKVTTVDRRTGEIGFKWRRRSTKVRVSRLVGGTRAGYVVLNDAPALVVDLAKVAEHVRTGHTDRRGRFLP